MVYFATIRFLSDSVHPTLFCWGELILLPNFQKKGGLAGSQFLEGVAGKEEGEFFTFLQFLHKK